MKKTSTFALFANTTGDRRNRTFCSQRIRENMFSCIYHSEFRMQVRCFNDIKVREGGREAGRERKRNRETHTHTHREGER